ncbi:MAG: metallophosphoesterase, partial [Planctomycetes bacterium]|nr:metallophosphoesterase [Planctomycetota bacterium]
MRSPAQVPRRHSALRLGIFGLCKRLAQWAGGRAFYRGWFLNPKRIVLRREWVCAPDLPAELEGLTILHLSDLHAGPFLGAGDLSGCLEVLGDRVPDLLAITGDFITDSHADALDLIPDLGRFPHRLGAFAVFGNHDYRGRKQAVLAEHLERQGIRVLEDSGARVGDLPLWIGGLSDLEETPAPDPSAARRGRRA